MSKVIVVDTNVIVSALLQADSVPRQVLRACFEHEVRPLVGNTLFIEYEAVIRRDTIFKQSPLSLKERYAFLDDFLSVCEWVSVYYLWRPNLRDEADNHVLELAVAGGAETIVTGNQSDFEDTALRFPGVTICSPRDFLTIREH